VGEPGRAFIDRQLRRQSIWLKESWLWLLRTKVIPDTNGGRDRPTALDVGCGPGFVMECLSEELRVRGVDIDPDMVGACRSRDLEVEQASAHSLPYEDGSFDIVYCTFLLLWLENPWKALREMARVSRAHILCLAEPDMGSRIDHPGELADVSTMVIDGLRAEGADPFIGRKLRALFQECGLVAEIGVHPGVWDIQRLRDESADEWAFIENAAQDGSSGTLDRLRSAWDEALAMGTLFQYNPVFYALGKRAG
jgi:SAM-dependent methyltransferase